MTSTRYIILASAITLLSTHCGFSTPDAVAVADHLDFSGVLARQLVGPQVVTSELQQYLEPRIPSIPGFESASDWNRYATRLRKEMLDKVVLRGEALRWAKAPLRVEWFETISGGAGYSIRKLRYEAVPGLWIPALLYLPDKLDAKAPVILNVNGHESIGKAVAYKQIRCINLAKRGMLALNIEWFGMGQLRLPNYSHGLMNQLDLCGTSGVAPFYLAMQRGLDVLLSLPHADTKRVAVTGLSGGGWQTIFFSALDQRVTMAAPVAGYSGFRTRVHYSRDLGDSEQAPCDMALVADYSHLTAMMAPRATLLIFNSKDDCCFQSGYAMPPLIEAARPIFRLLSHEDRLRSHVNEEPGTHNYGVDNRQAFYRMIGDCFYPADSAFDAQEIAADSEVKTPEELTVPLPPTNATFHSLALRLSHSLPRGPGMLVKPAALEKWRQEQRASLRAITKSEDYWVVPGQAEYRQMGRYAISEWRLRVGNSWSLPATDIQPPNPKGVTILISDAGRSSMTNEVLSLLAGGQRVVAIDPLFFGECVPPAKDAERWALFVGAVGGRPLGLQSSQVIAVSRWLASEHQFEPVTLRASGPRASLVAQVAAALEPGMFQRLELRDALRSLKDVISQNRPFREMPEAFCFGLLESFDIEQLTALACPMVTVQSLK